MSTSGSLGDAAFTVGGNTCDAGVGVDIVEAGSNRRILGGA